MLRFFTSNATAKTAQVSSFALLSTGATSSSSFFLQCQQQNTSSSSSVCCSSLCSTSSSSSSLFSPTQTLLKPFRRKRLPVREPQAGDWVCSCGHSNSKFRRDCIKCNGPAPPLPLGESRPKLPGEDPNDWACPCGKMNYRGNVNCHKCGMPKPLSAEQEEKNNGMWKCAKCACLNRKTRKFCFQCRALATIGGNSIQVNSEGKTAEQHQQQQQQN